MIPLAAIAQAAEILAVAVPALTKALQAIGCAIEGCDAEPTLDARPLPTGEAGISALHRLRMRGAGFVSQDADEIARSARAEKLAEGVVVIRRRPA